MNRAVTLQVLKAIALWVGAYVVLRLTLTPWRLVAKPSLSEIIISICLLSIYFFIWRKIRHKLTDFSKESVKRCWPSLVIFTIWAVGYLGFWRATQWTPEIGWPQALIDYVRQEFLGGFVLSEITEEIAYRGVLLLLLLKAGLRPLQAVILQALVFLIPHYAGVALGHMDFARSISTVLLGSIFGWSMIQTRRLSIPIFLHVFWNAISGFIFKYLE